MNQDIKIRNILNTFFSQSSGKNINLLKTEMEGHEPALCCHKHIYLSNKTLQIQIISYNTAQLVSYICWVSITKQEVPVLSPTTANCIGQLSSILTNYLKAPI